MQGRRFLYSGDPERLPEIEAAMRKKRIDRKTMYMILKYFALNPDCLEILKQQFPDV